MLLPKKWGEGVTSLIWCVLVISKARDGICCYTNCCCKTTDTVDCSGSDLTSAPDPVSAAMGWCPGINWSTGGEAIKTIYLERMNITEVPKETFMYYTTIETLSLDGGNLKRIKASAFCLTGQTSTLTSLSLKRNKVSEIDAAAFAGLTNLLTLDLSWNRMQHFAVDSLNSLISLTELRLDGNRIRRLNMRIFHSLHSLQRLYLSSNILIIHNQFPQSLNLLEELYLNNNSIPSLAEDVFKNLYSLNVIDLSWNQIKVLRGNLFENNRGLYKIDLSYNQLVHLPRDTFSDLCKLKILDISYNRLTTPRFEWFAAVVYQCNRVGCNKGVDDAVTVGNPWICDCNMAEYIMFLKTISNDVVFVDRGLVKYLDLSCTSDLHPVSQHDISLCFDVQEEMLKLVMRNENGTCSPDNPICPFLSPQCAGVKGVKKASHAMRQSKLNSTKTIYVAVVALLLTIMSVVGIACWRMRLRTASRKRHISDASYSSDSSSENFRSATPTTPLVAPHHARLPPEGSSVYGGSLNFGRSSFSGSLYSVTEISSSSGNISVTVPKSVFRLNTEPKQTPGGGETRPKSLISRSNGERVQNVYLKHQPRGRGGSNQTDSYFPICAPMLPFNLGSRNPSELHESHNCGSLASSSVDPCSQSPQIIKISSFNPYECIDD